MSEIAESFASSLSELTVNSKPHINMLTMLADDHLEYAPIITETVLTHLQKVPPEIKLPVLYLIDSIMKNVGKAYINLFTQNIVQCFTATFEKVDEKTREQMFKLRQTWSDVFPQKVIYALDAKVHQIDPAWPLGSPPSTVHLNPKFFKPDVLDSKLTSPTKQPEQNRTESRSHHRKNKTYSRQNHNVSKSTRSKKSSPTSTSGTDNIAPAPPAVPAKPSPTPEQLREQMIMKQKMLLELQQQKLKLELLQTQAQIEEQAKQLERHSSNNKTSHEISKLQDILKKEEEKLKQMNKNLKKHSQKFPNRQQIVRVTSNMKAQKVTDLSKVTGAMPESLVKPAALLELNQDDKPKPSVKPSSRPRIVLPLPTMDKQKVITPADSTEDAVPPVRIAPVSSQLINAALSFGRNVRDPRIRQMSSRLESQLNTVTPTTTTPTHPPLTSAPPPPTSVPVSDNKPHDRYSGKDKKPSNQHKERPSKHPEQESKSHSRSSSRSGDKSSRSKERDKDKTSPKRSEAKISSSRRARIEGLFSDSMSKSPLDAKVSSSAPHSLQQSHLNQDQNSRVETSEAGPKTVYSERMSKTESSPKRTKFQDKNNDVDSYLNSEPPTDKSKSSADIIKTQVKPTGIPPPKVSPEAMDSSSEMKDEDIEKIVKHPGYSKSKPLDSKLNETEKGEAQEILESTEETDYDMNEIVRNPNKQLKVDRRTNDDKVKQKSLMFGSPKKKKDEKDLTKVFVAKQETMVDSECRTSVDTFSKDNHFTESFTSEKQSVSKVPENVITRQSSLLEQSNIYKDHKSNTESNIGSSSSELPTNKFGFAEYVDKESESESISNLIEQDEVSSTINTFSFQNDINKSFIQEEVVSTETTSVEIEEYVPMDVEAQSVENLTPTESVLISSEGTESVPIVKTNDRLTLSPKKVMSPIRNVEPMETIVEVSETQIGELTSSKKSEKRPNTSSIQQEKKSKKGDKPSLMEQVIADAERHEASPSPPPPPVISDKFKGIKQSSLSRLRRVGRSREDLESPEPADVDLRTQIAPLPTLTKDLKNEVLGLAETDVDLRNLAASPTKKRPSMENALDTPPAKKSKAEVMDEWAWQVAKFPACKISYFPARPDPAHWYRPNYSQICIYKKRLFGSEDVDLRPVLCPPPPSPPPPPIISSPPPPEAAGERLWARYKQNKPDTYKVKYTPTRRDRAPSVDKFGRYNRLNSGSEGRWGSSGRAKNTEDVDMRAPPLTPDGSYNHIIIQAMEQHKRGDLDNDAYKRVLSEVFAMREKQQLEEAQRRDEEAQAEQLEPVSDDDISGSLSGVEDAPSPPESYSGGEDFNESSLKKSKTEDESDSKVAGNLMDVDIRIPPADLDIRIKSLFDTEEKPVDDKSSQRTRREPLPYTRRSDESEKEKYRRHRTEARASRREKKAKRLEEERDLRYRESNRYGQEAWVPPPEDVKVGEETEVPRVPPLPPYMQAPPLDGLPQATPVRPPHWDPQRMPGPGPAPGPWLPGMPPTIRAPPVMGLRPPQERFMPPGWHQPGPGPRFNRFGPPPMGRFPLLPLNPCEVPPTDQAVLKAIEEDPTRSINIDGVPRDIRFYGITAVALMSWDDPREISFQPGSRRVIIDERDSVIVHFNSPPVEVIIDGQPHRLRFGAPTRELFIDNQWFEVFFGGPPVACNIAGQPHMIQLEGPPPPVKPGAPRRDLVVGKITLIIDAEYFFTIYLDAKPQKFEVKGVGYIIRFVEALQKTVINGVPFKSDFGGLPKPIILNGNKHFFRLTALPRGVTPGFLSIANMEGGRLPSPPGMVAPPQLPASLEQAVLLPPPHTLTAPPRISPDVRDVEQATLIPPTPASASTAALVTTQPPNSAPPQVVAPAVPANSLDMLTTLLPATEQGRALASYSVDSEGSNPAVEHNNASNAPPSGVQSGTGEINVTELLQKLMATGIVPSLEPPKDKVQDKPVTTDSTLIKPVDFRKPETLKTRQTSLISHLYSGIQCNSCGVRFPPEQTMKYSQHLDWHFRQNRRDKDSSRTAQTRRYYYDVSDWVQFEEIEDLEERAQPWFEMQDGAGEEDEPERIMVSVRAADYPEEAACHICHDKFESFYNEEKDEWHLRNAADHEGNLVHPICLEDQKAAAEKPIVVEDIDITEDEPKEEEPKKEEESEEKKEKEAPKEEDDDDIMEVTDIEYIKPVFPVEDLTVSDNEEEKETKDTTENEDKELKKDEGEPSEEVSSTTEMEEIPKESKDESQDGEESKEGEEKEPETLVNEDSQDDLLMLVDKVDDSILSKDEIMEVVKNIKKDPDALGGEYEESDVKKEKGEIPLPAPVVDTTHATVTCLIDGNVEFEEAAQKISQGPPRIKINISKAIQPAPKEKKDESKEEEPTETPTIPDIISDNPKVTPTSLNCQPLPPGEEPIPVTKKERLKKAELVEYPPVARDKELSGLCSIM
ncbi:uncharacterized protein LOC128986927 isoform X2 [Macrosteles quadrilineatus]|uniref:uncharacterized protein LOC128986927 isoform X2 n=1 Tax=Macrosteles quadrilineatus TaxID=74068 RepID=UPI0023E27838|nr:uncharacterized protein LOC128986927 isoform X2 [Macrosteles quadrilineatus]